ncbi:hypothetical protein [uncultured Methanobrevibacter sp.]|uniref:hypothetical protein n=1 Tax=uncultured Methanobrevibacter sp. TaxID=253161 RepID=UPI0025D1E3C7|nr:hypothetical protein [uncultured Methanobrevibacter sp.]
MSNPKITSAVKEYTFNESHDAKYGNSENKKMENPYETKALLLMYLICWNNL